MQQLQRSYFFVPAQTAHNATLATIETDDDISCAAEFRRRLINKFIRSAGGQSMMDEFFSAQRAASAN